MYEEDLPTSNFQYNFNNFFTSLLLNLSTYQGVSWEYLMLEYARVNENSVAPWASNVYFILGFFFSNTVMMNLFLLTIIMKYDQFHSKEENPILKFIDLFEIFQSAWSNLAIDHGMRMKSLTLQKLLETTYENELDYKLDIKKLDAKYISELEVLQ